MFDLAGKRVWVAGDRGMVGSAIVRRLESEDCEILSVGRDRLDLRDQDGVLKWMRQERPEVVVIAAAKVGGILANDSQPVDFLLDNLLIETAIFRAAHATNVEKLLFLGSSCIYPKAAPQPIAEAALLTGPLEETNQWYAIAKIAGIKLAQAYRRQFGRDYISAMPTNLYGPGDNFNLATSHVMPALIRKVDHAKRSGAEVVLWGTGSPRREFLYVDDCAEACVHLLKHYSGEEHVNLGSGSDLTIADLTRLIMDVLGCELPIAYDLSKPDGTASKLMDSSKIRGLDWQPSTSLREGIERSYAWFDAHRSSIE